MPRGFQRVPAGPRRGGARTGGRPPPRRDAPRSRKHRASRAPDSVSSSRRTRGGRGPPSAGPRHAPPPSLRSPTGSRRNLPRAEMREFLNKILSIALAPSSDLFANYWSRANRYLDRRYPGAHLLFPEKAETTTYKARKNVASTPSTTGAVARALRPSPRPRGESFATSQRGVHLSEVDAPRPAAAATGPARREARAIHFG